MSCLNLPLVVQESALTSGFWGDGGGGGGGGVGFSLQCFPGFRYIHKKRLGI